MVLKNFFGNMLTGKRASEYVKDHKSDNSKQSNLMRIGRAMRIDAQKRGSNPIEEGRADIVPWILYDRQFTAAGSTTAIEYDFFTTPIGGTKTKQDTNMEQVSVL